MIEKDIFNENNWDIEEYPTKIPNCLDIYIEYNDDGTCNLNTAPKNKTIPYFRISCNPGLNIFNPLNYNLFGGYTNCTSYDKIGEDGVKDIIISYYNIIKKSINFQKKLLNPIKIKNYLFFYTINGKRKNSIFSKIYYKFNDLGINDFLRKNNEIYLYENNLLSSRLIVSEKINIFNSYWKLKKYEKKVNEIVNDRKKIYDNFSRDVKKVIIKY